MDKFEAPRKPTRRAEIDAVLSLFAADNDMEKLLPNIQGRLRLVPNAYRDYRLAQKMLSKTIDNLLMTIPDEKLITLNEMVKHVNYKVHYNAVAAAKEPGMSCIKLDQLSLLAKAAHENCKLCVSEDCNRCKLGKILDRLVDEDRDKHESWALIDLGSWRYDE